jgi:hypothetical protein
MSAWKFLKNILRKESGQTENRGSGYIKTQKEEGKNKQTKNQLSPLSAKFLFSKNWKKWYY